MLFLSGRVVPAGDAGSETETTQSIWHLAMNLRMVGRFREAHPGAPQANRSSGVGPCGLLTIPWRVPVWPHEPLSQRGPGTDAAAPVYLRAPAESWD